MFLPIQNNRKDTSWKFTTKESKIFVQQNPSSVVKNSHQTIHKDLQKKREREFFIGCTTANTYYSIRTSTDKYKEKWVVTDDSDFMRRSKRNVCFFCSLSRNFCKCTFCDELFGVWTTRVGVAKQKTRAFRLSKVQGSFTRTYEQTNHARFFWIKNICTFCKTIWA